MVGAALAQLLARADFSVALLERAGLVRELPRSVHHARVSAINLGSERILTAAGAWRTIETHGVAPYIRMFVWDANSNGRIEFDSAELGVAHLGTIVENGLVVFALHKELLAAGVQVLENSEPAGVEADRDRVTLTLNSGESVQAKVLVGADGSGSWVRRELGIVCESRGIDQLALSARVGTELDHRQTAWQKFLATGPLAFLPLSNGECSIVWSCERELANDLMAMDDAEFSKELAHAFSYRLGEITSVGPRQAYALAPSLAHTYIGDRAVLVGDSAHVVHPLAGQGVNLGFADAAALVQVLVDARAGKRNFGGKPTLRRYERWRKGDNMVMYHAFNGIEKLFHTERESVCRIRGLGLALTDRIGPLKSAFATKAMGLSGEFPRIMSGRAD